MQAEKMTNTLTEELAIRGYEGKVLSSNYIFELQREIESQYQRGLFDEAFYAEELTGFNFKIPETISDAKSMIVVAAPQPQVRVTFNWDGKSYPCVIPPTYSYATDERIKNLLEQHLVPKGYRFEKVILPWKLLAVHSGLAQYGKNNITYIQGMGSFYRLVAFVSDLPCSEEHWQELEVLEQCGNCDACMKACPSGAIGADRFLLHGERCVTFHNERQGEFPRWLKPSWHNCLVGCMVCQKVCPINKAFRKWVVDGPAFSEEETQSILFEKDENKAMPGVVRKLEALDMIDYRKVLGRNLSVLHKKIQKP
jgi:epoxyqueuosine reductase